MSRVMQYADHANARVKTFQLRMGPCSHAALEANVLVALSETGGREYVGCGR